MTGHYLLLHFMTRHYCVQSCNTVHSIVIQAVLDMTHHDMTRYIISSHALLSRVMRRHKTPYSLSYPIFCYPVLLHPIVSCPVPPYPVLPRPIPSYPVLPLLNSLVLSRHFLSIPGRTDSVLSCPILFTPALTYLVLY